MRSQVKKREGKIDSIYEMVMMMMICSTYRWTSLIPLLVLFLGWLYCDIECGGCGGPALPRTPDKSDWGCCADCWLEPTWCDRIAASISFRRCHLLNLFTLTHFLFQLFFFFNIFKKIFLNFLLLFFFLFFEPPTYWKYISFTFLHIYQQGEQKIIISLFFFSLQQNTKM